jgi:hypothetical protein
VLGFFAGILGATERGKRGSRRRETGKNIKNIFSAVGQTAQMLRKFIFNPKDKFRELQEQLTEAYDAITERLQGTRHRRGRHLHRLVQP